MTRFLTSVEGRLGPWGIAAMLACLALADPSAMAEAHPMGNFSINHYAGLELTETEIRLRYILDLAEIPTFQEMDLLDRDRNGDITAAERERYASEKASALAQGLVLAFALGSLFNDFLFDTTEGHLWALVGGALFGAAPQRDG